jgi:hypothetical protein
MTGGGHTFGGGAAPGLLSVLAGRLLCDTYLSGERAGIALRHGTTVLVLQDIASVACRGFCHNVLSCMQTQSQAKEARVGGCIP